MTAKIRELNLDDLKNVSGGVTVLATATSTQTLVASPIRPIATSTTQLSFGSSLFGVRLR
jgi:hypothetical protein